MLFLNGHLNLTGKSLSAAAGGVIAVVAAFGYLTPDKAAAITSLVVVLCALLVPDREQGTDASTPTP